MSNDLKRRLDQLLKHTRPEEPEPEGSYFVMGNPMRKGEKLDRVGDDVIIFTLKFDHANDQE
jgi:hypothetical protein